MLIAKMKGRVFPLLCKWSVEGNNIAILSDETVGISSSNRPEGCCGTHLVCEKETLLQTNVKVEYYDDEELDELAGIAPEDYTEEQVNAIREVFGSLQESDVPGWCRSMQLRNINLPQDIREEALLIVRELRQKQ